MGTYDNTILNLCMLIYKMRLFQKGCVKNVFFFKINPDKFQKLVGVINKVFILRLLKF